MAKINIFFRILKDVDIKTKNNFDFDINLLAEPVYSNAHPLRTGTAQEIFPLRQSSSRPDFLHLNFFTVFGLLFLGENQAEKPLPLAYPAGAYFLCRCRRMAAGIYGAQPQPV